MTLGEKIYKLRTERNLSQGDLFMKIMHNLLANAKIWIYSFFHSIYVWLYTGFFVAAVALTVRYFYTKKNK